VVRLDQFRGRRARTCSLLAVVLLTAWQASAATLSVTQVSGRQFTDLNGGSPADGSLSGEFPSSTLIAQRSAGGTTRRFGFEFPISAIPFGAAVTSATFTAAESTDTGGGSAIYARPGDGIVSESDLFDFSTLVGGVASGAGNGLVGGVSVDVTAVVQALAAASESFLVLSFHPDESSSNGSYSLQNFDGGGAAIDPQLTISYTVPEPSSLALAAIGAAGILTASKRRRAKTSAKRIVWKVSTAAPDAEFGCNGNSRPRKRPSKATVSQLNPHQENRS